MSIRPTALLLLPLMCSLSLLSPEPAAAARDGGVRMEVLVDGTPLREISKSSTRYVEAYKNQEYAIRLTNRTAGRVAVALAVDGLNTIDAKHSSALAAKKWIIDPWRSLTIQGWQVSGDRARRFVFTSEEQSYGAWLGKTRDLGIVSAVFYREQPQAIRCCDEVYVPRGQGNRRLGERDRHDHWDGDLAQAEDAEAPHRSASRRPAAEPTESAASGSAGDAPSYRAKKSADASRGREAKRKERAATGIGRGVGHDVVYVDFRLDSSPIGSVELRYGFRDELVELGVLPERADYDLARRQRASGFAPDPGYCCR